MANIPSNLSYGTVAGRFILAYADSVDSGSEPDAIPAQGSIFFKPSPILLKDVTASPSPVTILPATVEATLDSEGYLCGYGTTRGIILTATDDADAQPVDWTWGVEFRLTDSDGTTISIPGFSFELPGGQTVDLTGLTPVPDANGTFYLVGPTGPANELTVGTVDTGTPGTDAEVTITGTAPDQTINFVIPQGNKGDAGELTVGTVTTGAAGSSASVTNVGTTTDAILDFVIPKGDKGDKGDTGNTGATGPTGATGATGLNWQGEWSDTADYINDDAVYYDGASWFASGDPIIGEEPTISATHWMPLALQGITGPTGPEGPQGIQGIQGIQGSTGPTGPEGRGYFGIYTNPQTMTMGLGSKSFSMEISTLGAFAVGQRIRLVRSSDASVWLEGQFTSLTSSSITVDVDVYSGTGTYSSTWKLVSAGERGIQGPAGTLENLTAVSPIVYTSTTSTLTFDDSQIVTIDGGTA